MIYTLEQASHPGHHVVEASLIGITAHQDVASQVASPLALHTRDTSGVGTSQ